MSIMRVKLPAAVCRDMRKYPAFYRKVWRACAAIPKGRTVTYGELAKKIGCKGGARAVGQALARNPFAPIIPCHRVIRSDGTMGGYSGPGGIKKKIEMLHKEKTGAVSRRRIDRRNKG